MTLPVDLVLVRHAQSEINQANAESRSGDDRFFTKKHRDQHTASLPLSDRGRYEQAPRTGAYIIEEFIDKGIVFDRFVTSEYLRAIETAGLLGLPGASWYIEPYLAERDWGELDMLPNDEREKKFMAELRRRHAEPYFWNPPNGESLKQTNLYVDRVIESLRRAQSKKPAILVCHGEVMWTFRLRLEYLSQLKFRELLFSKGHANTIFNCQIIHYTRVNPETDELAPYMGWVRWIRPTETPVTTSGWQKIVRPRYSNAELLEVVRRRKAMDE